MSSILLDFSTIGCIINIMGSDWVHYDYPFFLLFLIRNSIFWRYMSILLWLDAFQGSKLSNTIGTCRYNTRNPIHAYGMWPHSLCCDTALWYFIPSKAAEYMNLLCRETFVSAMSVQVVSLKQFFYIMIEPNICFVLWLIFSKTWKIWKIWYIIIYALIHVFSLA